MSQAFDPASAPESEAQRERRHMLSWAGPLNMTDIIKFSLGLVTLVGVYYGMDKRLTRLEDLSPVVAEQRKEKDAAVQNALTTLTLDVKEVKVVVDKVSRSLDVQNAVTAAQEKRK